MSRSNRRGFALMLVLWMLIGVAAVGAGLASTGRFALQSSTNRILLARGAWLAEGCIERARAVVDDTLSAPAIAAAAGWLHLDDVVASASQTASCDLHIHPVGVALDVNVASSEQLSLLAQVSGAQPELADSVADAIMDWRDEDDLPRASGAEASWYLRLHLLPPRNGPIAAREELQRVRGVSNVPNLDSLLGVEPGRILVGRAPAAVLASLPGFGPEAIARAMSLSSDPSPRDLLGFSQILSAPARQEIAIHFAELQQRITFMPDAWIIAARASVGRPSVESTVEIRLIRNGRRAAVERRRSWP